MKYRVFLAAIAASFAVSVCVADLIKKTNGDVIVGTVTRFEANTTSPEKGEFVVARQGKSERIPIADIESISFTGPVAAAPRTTTRETDTKEGKAETSTSGEYWISSTGKRHNSSCRYYKSSKGRPGGPTDGVACKSCGG